MDAVNDKTHVKRLRFVAGRQQSSQSPFHPDNAFDLENRSRSFSARIRSLGEMTRPLSTWRMPAWNRKPDAPQSSPSDNMRRPFRAFKGSI